MATGSVAIELEVLKAMMMASLAALKKIKGFILPSKLTDKLLKVIP